MATRPNTGSIRCNEMRTGRTDRQTAVRWQCAFLVSEISIVKLSDCKNDLIPF
jgi:hypothetical protein